MLRRSSSHIQLPDRKDLKIYLTFSGQEQEVYSAAKAKALDFIDDVLSSQKVTGAYKNAVQKINHLRLICNHGLWQPNNGHADSKLEVERSGLECWSSTAAHKALNRLPSLGLPIACIECNNPIDLNISNEESQLLGPISPTQAHLTRCCRLWCTACYSSRKTLWEFPSFCSCDKECPIATVQLETLSRSSSPFAVSQNDQHEHRAYPTKIRALLDDVQKLPSSTKR